MSLAKARAFKAIERYAKLTQNLTIILGIFTGVISLFATQYDRRVSRTVEMTKLYTEKIRADYLMLVDKWDAKTESIDNFFQLKPDEMSKLVVGFFKEAETKKLLLNYLDFFDELTICIENRACDRNSAIEYFSGSARFAYGMSGQYTAYIRESDRDPDFGRGLERFYRMKPECAVSRYL